MHTVDQLNDQRRCKLERGCSARSNLRQNRTTFPDEPELNDFFLDQHEWCCGHHSSLSSWEARAQALVEEIK